LYNTITSDPYGSAYAGVSSYSGAFDIAATTVASPGLTNASTFTQGKPGFTTVLMPITAGVHTLVCMQGDSVNTANDSGLIIDNAVFTPSANAAVNTGGGCIAPAMSAAQAGSVLLMIGTLLIGLGLASRRRKS